MNATRAMEIVRDIEALSGNTKEYPIAYWEARSLLKATKATEPLLEEIKKLQDAVGCFQGALALHIGDGGAVTGDLLAADKIGEDAHCSSAQVVEKYRKECLGE